MQILQPRQIAQKITRLSIQMLERNHDAREMILVGINERGLAFATLIMRELLQRSDLHITLTRVWVNSAAKSARMEMPIASLENKNIIVIDDVANRGSTIFYALRPLMDIAARKIELAVLVDRKHKAFPIQPDYVGLSLATTLQDNIRVELGENPEHWAAFLE